MQKGTTTWNNYISLECGYFCVNEHFYSSSDVNECTSPDFNRCQIYADCTNEPGTYRCSCKAGYKATSGSGYIEQAECACSKNTYT